MSAQINRVAEPDLTVVPTPQVRHVNAPQTYAPTPLGFGEVAGTLWRGKWRILLSMLFLGALFALYAVRLAVPTYTATTSVVLESRSTQILDIEGVISGLSGETVDVNTQVEILQSEALLSRVVDALDLAGYAEFQPKDWRERVPEQVAAALPGAFQAPPRALSEDVVHAHAIAVLDKRVSVRNVPQSLVFVISVETEKAALSQQIADTLARIYIDDQRELKQTVTRQATAWLSERLTQLQDELQVSETAVKDFVGQTDLVSAEALLDLQRQLKAQRHRISQAQSTYSAAGGSFDGARTPQNRAERQLAALMAGRDQLEAQISAQSQDLIRLEQLEREAEAARAQYAHFLNRYRETSVQEGIQRPDARVLSPASFPQSATSPRTALLTVLGMTLGLVFGAIWVSIRESQQTGYRSGLQLELATGVPVMGQIPKAARSGRKSVFKLLQRSTSSAFGEAIRNLRTSLLATNLEAPPRIIMLTSSVPAEGKTTQAIAISANLAALGKRVLLIEGDVRRRVFDTYFHGAPKTGLLTALSHQADIDDILHSDPALGIDVLVGEPSDINAADVFESGQFGALIEDLVDRYDHIIIDTPPVLAVPDARVIGRHADAILYVVKWDQTASAQVNAGLNQLTAAGLKVDGLILSQIDAKGMTKYGLAGTYGGYDYGYYDSKA